MNGLLVGKGSIKHAPRCLGSFLVCTCAPCPGECGEVVNDPTEELCKECDRKAELNRQMDCEHFDTDNYVCLDCQKDLTADRKGADLDRARDARKYGA